MLEYKRPGQVVGVQSQQVICGLGEVHMEFISSWH